ncbi:MAG: PorP/SprF family type IX secretion system membrane protein [Bacteroidota bacterium]|nr:PorP/SprF family type IX secretion system membrane protein [Bacteroidota bacterium]
MLNIKSKGFSLILFLFLAATSAYSQDPLFSQYYASALHINPAFAGLSDAPRFAMNYRNQWPQLGQSFRSYVTYSASYDQNFESLKSGFGVQILADDAGGGLIKNSKFAGYYGYRMELPWSGHFIKAGIEVGLVNLRYDWDKFVFGDQIDPESGFLSPGGTPILSREIRPDKTSANYLDVGTGMLYYSQEFYVGVGIKHINTPDNSILKINQDAFSGVPIRWTFHGGYEKRISKRGRIEQLISPAFLLARQAKFFQFNVGLNYQYSSVFTGLWFRYARQSPDALIALVGFRKEFWKLAYSFDYTLSDIEISQGGSHELSLLINLASTLKKKPNVSDCFEAFR